MDRSSASGTGWRPGFYFAYHGEMRIRNIGGKQQFKTTP